MYVRLPLIRGIFDAAILFEFQLKKNAVTAAKTICRALSKDTDLSKMIRARFA